MFLIHCSQIFLRQLSIHCGYHIKKSKHNYNTELKNKQTTVTTATITTTTTIIIGPKIKKTASIPK